MWTYNNIDELYHYGILGMKWGHRKNKIGNTLVKTVDASSNYIKRDIKDFLHINKDTNKNFYQIMLKNMEKEFLKQLVLVIMH